MPSPVKIVVTGMAASMGSILLSAAKKGDRYLNALKKHEAVIAKNVTENLFERHMKPLLSGK